MPASAAFAETSEALRKLMVASATGMIVAEENETTLVLHAPFANPLKPKEPMWFGMVRTGKAYVGYHLLPLYMNPRLSALVTPSLKKRMQGKSCFNFTAVNEALFAELGLLTTQCTQGWKEDLSKAIAGYQVARKK
ncbi:MAG: hypothetical protein ABMA14_13095 [Hyphomonadaceae bacterium]